MKKSLIFSGLAIAILSFSCKTSSNEPTTTYEVVGVAENVPGHYGDIIEDKDIFTPAEMIATVEAEGNFQGKIQGEIKEVCASKGCWFTMDLPNGNSMRVTFKDYGFFLPTNSQGFPLVMEGVATVTETDVETLKHYAEDQGKSKEEVDAIIEPKKEITFEATGVIIKAKV